MKPVLKVKQAPSYRPQSFNQVVNLIFLEESHQTQLILHVTKFVLFFVF